MIEIETERGTGKETGREKEKKNGRGRGREMPAIVVEGVELAGATVADPLSTIRVRVLRATPSIAS